MRQHRHRAFLLASLAGAAGVPAAEAQTRYALIKFGSQGASTCQQRFSHATSVNSKGQVVGAATADEGGQCVMRAFVWQNGVQTMLPSSVSPNEHLVLAKDINEAGLIAGEETLPSGEPGVPGPRQLIVWDANNPGAPPQTFGPSMPNKPNLVDDAVAAINDNGVVVGGVYLGLGIPQFPFNGTFVWTLDVNVGQFEFIWDPDPIAQYQFARDINNKGVLTGGYADQLAFVPGLFFTACRWVNGDRIPMDPLPTLPGIGFFHYGISINEQGVVVGHSDAPVGSGEPFSAAMWVGTERTLLDPPNFPPGHHLYVATSINESGQIVGSGTRGNPLVFDPFLLDNGQVTWLNDLIPPGSEFTNLEQAAAISDTGWIVGTGRTSTDPDIVGFILKPVDGCYPDCNQSGSLTVADFTCFQSRFVAGEPYADCNQSGTLTVADFTCFQNAFVAGCP